MTTPRLIRIEGRTEILPSFTRIQVDGNLYLLTFEQKRWMVEHDAQFEDNTPFERAVRDTVKRFKLEPVTAEEADRKADWELIVDALYPLTTGRKVWLDSNEATAVHILGDGYGKMTEAQLQEKALLWDWSHVRDSSPAAIKEMASKIREFVARR